MRCLHAPIGDKRAPQPNTLIRAGTLGSVKPAPIEDLGRAFVARWRRGIGVRHGVRRVGIVRRKLGGGAGKQGRRRWERRRRREVRALGIGERDGIWMRSWLVLA